MKVCTTCWARPWASDDWRTTGMLNYNNKLLVDIRLLVRTRNWYRMGTPLSVIFHEFLTECKNDYDWVDKNDEMAQR